MLIHYQMRPLVSPAATGTTRGVTSRLFDSVDAVNTFIQQLLEDSAESGWAVGRSPVHPASLAVCVAGEAAALGLTAVENRSGESPLDTLRPTTLAEARPASLSAVVGLGEQPFHTDGAHLRRVPDFVLLWCLQPNATPTQVWKPRPIGSENRVGIFIVKNGKKTWLAPAIEANGALRFDPVCMTPGDASARWLSEELQSPPPEEVQSVSWDFPGRVLALRNRKVLHRRAALADGDGSRVLVRAAYELVKT